MKIWFVLALGATACVSAPALASDSKAGIEVGKCLVRSDRAAAVGLMKSLPLAGEKVDVASLSFGSADKCRAGATAPIAVTALRGGIAQELFQRDFGEYGTQPREAVYKLAAFQLPVEKDTLGTQDPIKSLYLTADCVARSDPKTTERLLKASPGTRMEDQAFDQLGPLLAACGAQPGASIARTDLRGAIVQAAYYVNARYWNGGMTYAGPAFRP